MSAWADVVGPEGVARGRAEDAVDGSVPPWVVRPRSVAEVQACVAAAAREGQALVASGLGAHLDVGGRPARLDLLLRLDRLDRILDHQAGDMTVTVEAGCPLPSLAAVLAQAGQWLPLDPPRSEVTTVGGLLAADLSGPLRASQGRARDLLIGIRVVDAEGALVAGGGRVVKNVAGYDLPKLHVGALGTVGVIVEATFKVRPRPEREEAVVMAAATAGAAAEAATAVLDAGVDLLWLEVAGAGGIPEGPGDGAAVAVGLGGAESEVADGRARLFDMAAARGLAAIAVADGSGLRARLGGFATEPAAAVLRASVLPTDVGGVLQATRGPGLRCLAHAANGVVRIAVADAAAVGPLLQDLRRRTAPRGGVVVVERARPEVKAAVDVWGDVGEGIGLMRRLKATFDARGILAPGRFVGGL